MGATVYTVTAYNFKGQSSTTVTLTVNPAAPTVPTPASICGSGSTTINASGGAPAGGTYNWYSAAAGGILLQGTVSASYTTPTLTATTSYYVSYTVNGVTSTRTPVTVTVTGTSAFSLPSAASINSNVGISYTGSDPNTATYLWTFTGGTPSTGAGQGPFSVTWSTTGAKAVSLKVTNGACNTTTNQTITIGPAFANYGFQKVITLNNAAMALGTDLPSFPALISFQDNDLIISGTCNDKVYNPNGPNYDFAFTVPGSAVELPYQVESYNKLTGALLVWVQIPTLTHATNNTLQFYYGSKISANHTTAFYQGTWAGDYKSVFHFGETTYSGTTADNTSGGHTGTATGMTSANLVAGKIGNSYSFAGGQVINCGPVNVTTPFTISAWVNLSSVGLDQKVMTNQATGGGSTGGYKLGVYTDNTVEAESGSSFNRPSTPASPALTTGTWHYIQGVFTGTTLSSYVDGVAYKNLATTTAPSSITALYIGTGEGGNQYYFNGLIDEVRVSNVAKSADWLKAEYTDQNNPAAFTAISSTGVVNTTNAATVAGGLTYTWTGGTSTDPTVAGNWNNTTAGTTSQAPALDGSATLIIPAGAPRYPLLIADASLYGLTIASGASFNLGGHILSVACNIYNSTGGQILYGSSNTSQINWNGSLAQQTYTGTNTSATAQLGAMTINNSSGGTVTISGGPVDIYNTLTITKGNLVVSASPAALTLKSTATSSASVSALPAGSSITGSVTVERFLTGGSSTNRGYRLLSSAVNSDGTNYSINYLKNSIIVVGTNTAGGFDNTSTAGNPTLFLFREDKPPSNTSFTSGNFRGINNITSGNNATPAYTMDVDGGPFSIPIGNGFLCFFRGDRVAGYAAETTPSYVPTSTVTSAKGNLNQGTITVKDWFTPASTSLSYTLATPSTIRGFNLIGNPYASTINFEKFNRNGTNSSIYGAGFAVPATIYFFNPTTKQYASYKQAPTISLVTDTTSTIKPAGSISSDGFASNMIATGEAFFIQAGASNQTMVFHETAKTSTQPPAATLTELLGKPKETAQLPDPLLRLRLVKDSVNTDEVVITFNHNNRPNYEPAKDALDFGGNGAKESLSAISGDSILLSIAGRSFPTTTQEIISLFADATATGSYQLKNIELNNLPRVYDVWLMDSFTKDSVNLRNTAIYNFNIDKSLPATSGTKRFYLSIRQNADYAYKLLDFSANKLLAISQVQVNWKVQNEENYTNFTVERSTDGGTTFDVLGGVNATGAGSYGFLDKSPTRGVNIYRLKQEDLDNTISYSNTVPILFFYQNDFNVHLYPNPAFNLINLDFTAKAEQNGNYKIIVTSSSGAVVRQANSVNPYWQSNISNLQPGTYLVRVLNEKTAKMLTETKFVKL